MLNTKNTTEATPRVTFTPSNGVIKTAAGNSYEINLHAAIKEFSDELPANCEPHQIKEWLRDLRNVLTHAEFPDMNLKTFQHHLQIIELCQHFFINLIGNPNEKE